MKKKILLLGAMVVLGTASSMALDLSFNQNQSNQVQITQGADGVYSLTLHRADATAAWNPYVATNPLGKALDQSSNRVTFEYTSTQDVTINQTWYCINGMPETEYMDPDNPITLSKSSGWQTATVDLSGPIEFFGFGSDAKHYLRFDLGTNDANEGTVIQIRNLTIPGTSNPLTQATGNEVSPNKYTILEAEDYDSNTYDDNGNLLSEGWHFPFGMDTPSSANYRKDKSDSIVRVTQVGYASNGYYIDNMGCSWVSGYMLDKWVDKSKHLISWDDARENWGGWLDYTINVTSPVIADIDINAGIEYNTWTGISDPDNNSEVKKQVSVEGVTGDWMSNFNGCLQLAVDGNILKTNQTKVPIIPDQTGPGGIVQWGGPNEAEQVQQLLDASTKVLNDQSSWIDNPYPTVFNVLPDPKRPTVRGSYGNYQDKYGKPAYTGVKLSAGKHVIRLYSLGATWDLDCIRVTAQEDPDAASGITSTKNDDATVAVYAANGTIYSNVAANVYSISGVQVAKNVKGVKVPAGIYIVKTPSKVVKLQVK